MTLVRFELQRIMRRRGSFFGAMGTGIAFAVLTVLLTGDQTQAVWEQVLAISMVLGATVVGSLAGSYDTSQGTMRYLVLTGQPRWKLVLLRVPALVAAIVLVALPAVLICIAAMGLDGQPGDVIARLVVGTVLAAAAWGVVSMAVGTMLRSNGAGIGVALVLFLAGSVLTEVVRDKVSETAGDYLLNNVVGVVATLGTPAQGEEPFTIGLAAGAVALVAWLLAFMAVSVVRAERDEY